MSISFDMKLYKLKIGYIATHQQHEFNTDIIYAL